METPVPNGRANPPSNFCFPVECTAAMYFLMLSPPLPCSNHHFQIAWYLFGGKGCGIKPGQTDTQALLDWARQ